MIIRSSNDQMTSNMLVKHYAGSHSYGTALPTSDVDFRGIFVADPISVRTPFFRLDEVEDFSEEDTKFFELSKFVKLALDNNPNIVETLWVDPIHIVHTSPEYQLLRNHRSKFLTKKIAVTTVGYAVSQLSRIKGHNKWISNPKPESPPRQCDFVNVLQVYASDLPFKVKFSLFHSNHRLIPYGGDVYGVIAAPEYSTINTTTGALNTFYESTTAPRDIPRVIVQFNNEAYQKELAQWKGYWTWKKERNPVRAELEQLHTFDTKHALHLIRLLKMGAEALADGVIHVHRHDAPELLDIRNGKWSYDQVIDYSEQIRSNIGRLLNDTKLPDSPDIEAAAELIMTIQDSVWSRNR